MPLLASTSPEASIIVAVFQEVYKLWSIYYYLDGMIPTYYAVKGAQRSANFTNIGVLKQWIDSITDVATTLTFTANKTVVIPSEPITFSGRLTRNDTAAGVAGEPLDLQIYNYGAWATVWTVPATDSNGNFSFSRNAETSSGTWRYRMVYAGNA